MKESSFFAHWIGSQPDANISSKQVKVTTHILERLDNGDLISVMFYADGNLSLRALDELKRRYKYDRFALEEMNCTQYPED